MQNDGGTNSTILTSRCQEETVRELAKQLVERICQGLVNGMGSNGQPFGNGMAPTFEVALLELIQSELGTTFDPKQNPNARDRLLDAVIDGISGSLSKVNGSTMLLYTMIHGPNVGKFKELMRVVFMIAANDMKTMQKSKMTMSTFIDKVIHLLFSQDAVLYALVPSRPNPTQRGGQGLHIEPTHKHRIQRKNKQRKRATRKYVGGKTTQADVNKCFQDKEFMAIIRQNYGNTTFRDMTDDEIKNNGFFLHLCTEHLKKKQTRIDKVTRSMAGISLGTEENKTLTERIGQTGQAIANSTVGKGIGAAVGAAGTALSSVANAHPFNQASADEAHNAHMTNRTQKDTERAEQDKQKANTRQFEKQGMALRHQAELESSNFKAYQRSKQLGEIATRKARNAISDVKSGIGNYTRKASRAIYDAGHSMGNAVRGMGSGIKYVAKNPLTSLKMAASAGLQSAKYIGENTRGTRKMMKNVAMGTVGLLGKGAKGALSGLKGVGSMIHGSNKHDNHDQHSYNQGNQGGNEDDIEELVNDYGTTLIQKLSTRLQTMEGRITDRILDAIGELLRPGAAGSTAIVETISKILGQSMVPRMAQFGDKTMYSLMCTMLHNEQATLGDAIEASYAKFAEVQSKQESKGDTSIAAFLTALQTDAILDQCTTMFNEKLTAELFPPSN